jgi:type I restriction enzyme S subunit
MTQELERLTFGATIKTIGMPDVKTLRVPVPPIDEQEMICDYIASCSATIDQLQARVKSALGLLKEHRSAIITAAVTGQLDVKSYRSKNLPEEVRV